MPSTQFANRVRACWLTAVDCKQYQGTGWDAAAELESVPARCPAGLAFCRGLDASCPAAGEAGTATPLDIVRRKLPPPATPSTHDQNAASLLPPVGAQRQGDGPLVDLLGLKHRWMLSHYPLRDIALADFQVDRGTDPGDDRRALCNGPG